MRTVKTHPFLKAAHHTAISYKPPASLSYFWNFGVLALLCLVIQFITGIFLAMHYVSDPSLAFNSVEHIMRDVNYGWLIRYIHANGASMFFLVVYIHIFRGLYYGSYLFPRHLLWISGVIILLLMILTAFMGYVLPWGQMSFWAATVITKLASAVPFIGDNIVTWLWGGYSVGGPTLTRFFSFHYLMPFIIAALVILHILLLHEAKSNNPLGLANVDNIQFTPYFLIKDVFGIFVFFILFSYFLFFDPNVLGHTDNYVKANSMVTPTHIVPEWYFLPFYAILRSVPDKLGGVVLMLASILVLVMFPFITFSKIRSNSFKFFQKIIFWAFAVNCLILGWIGGQSTDSPYYEIGQLSTIYYFLYLIILVAGLNILEKKIWKKFEKKKK